MRIERLGEGVRLAIDQLRSNRIRSALTILGIVVGVATVVTMSAMITGIRTSVLEMIEVAGPKNFIVARFNFNDVQIVSDGSRPAWADNPPITTEEVRRIAELDRIRTAIVDMTVHAAFVAGGRTMENVQVSASSTGWDEFTMGTFTRGHNFLPIDEQASRLVVVLSTQLAKSLFGDLDPLGRTVRIKGVPFRVIGIFEPSANIFGDVAKTFAVVPYTTALKYLGADHRWMSVLAVTAEHSSQDEAIDQVVTLLRSSRGLRPADPNNFAIIKQEEMAKTFNRLTGVFFIVMLALSSVGLMVGGVGVIGIMMISVTERTREIGVRKALGATRREILWQFLVESSTVTLVGGAIGMLAGALLTFLVQAVTPIPAAIPLWAVLAALVMAAVSGIIFGLWPAWRAARLDPVVALRYE